MSPAPAAYPQAAGCPSRPRVAYLVEARLPGGTSAAVAAELRAISGLADLCIHQIDTGMFSGRPTAPALAAALDDLGLDLRPAPPTVAADLVILHNPSVLKFVTRLPFRIVARQLIIVAHENFARPSGPPGFDVDRCMRLIDRSSLALEKLIAPVSAFNRETVTDWASASAAGAAWGMTEGDWFNVCNFPVTPPARQPRDRRGRHSRPGFEKFPALDILDRIFPPTAEANILLGADHLAQAGLDRPHWSIYPFRSLDLAEYFSMIDVMVYFTAPTWRESFGRVLAEAIAAGKLVITDPETARSFGPAVVAAHPDEVNAVIARHIEAPAAYAARITAAQDALAQFSAARFRAGFAETLAGAGQGLPA